VISPIIGNHISLHNKNKNLLSTEETKLVIDYHFYSQKWYSIISKLILI